MKGPRIGFLVPGYRRDSKSRFRAVMDLLRDAGAAVHVLHPARRAIDLSTIRVDCDLYVLKRTSGVALSLAGMLDAMGATIINPYRVTATLRDKIAAARVLAVAGLPVPASYLAARPEELLPLLDAGPLVVKPYMGAGGHGVRVVRTAAELQALPVPRKEPVLAQRYHEPEGRDRKLYRIGHRYFGVLKVFPARTEEEKHGEPFDLTPELRTIARRCGEAFGIDCYGVDVIESGGRLYVVDIASMPGFKGVPNAPRLLAEYFYAAAERAVHGRPQRATAAAV